MPKKLLEQLERAVEREGGNAKPKPNQEVIDEILATEYTEANARAAKRFLEGCAYTTTALAALATAVDELEATAQADYLRGCCDRLAEIEADEI